MAAATKRTYKLQEFVAHATDVNCIKIGRRTSRILITGGEDQKVNLWAIGKPSAILSLSGLTSPVESVSFDSSEVMVAAGAASGTIKIWDVEEAKVVRTFTGHRSNCASLDFHPFGEFFASGSSDTNMKIWDIRKKGCIHTYKGHTRRIDVLRFTPDGRWIVSGGADSSVKVWDLTAGKLLNDFRLHEGPINCIDFHPHEFLLATGSADKTVKFWDLETFELIGFSEPENSREYFVPASVVRSMTFNSDGKTLFCGLHESLKVLTWEPIVCHDVVDVGWSTLVDLNVHEGKLLGCSYNQSCVGIWVVDLTKIEPYAVNNAQANSNESTSHPRQADSSISSVLGRLSVSRSPARQISSNTMHRRSISASKELSFPDSPIVTKRLQTTDLWHATASVSPRVRLNPDVNTEQRTQTAVVAPLAASKTTSQVDLSTSPGTVYCNSLGSAGHTYRSRYSLSADNSKESSFVPVVIPRNSSKMNDRSNLSKGASVEPPVINPRNTFKGNPATGHGKEDDKVVTAIASRSSRVDLEAGPTRDASDVVCIMPKSSNLRVKLDSDSGRSAPESEKVLYTLQPKPISSQRKCTRDALGGEDMNYSGSVCTESVESNEVGDWYNISGFEKPKPAVGKNPELVKINRSAMSGLSQLMKSTESNTVEYRPTSVNYERSLYPPTLDGLRRLSLNDEEQTTSAGDDDVMADLMENHQEFLTVSQSRLTKLQVVYRYWQSNDIKGALDAMKRISDLAVIADAVSVLMDNRNRLTLYLCTSLLPLISNLLESRLDRHLKIALESILTLVKSFGGIISSTLSAAPLVGVDLEAERRFERCNLCFLELEKIKAIALSMTRQRGEIGRLAQELSLLLQEIVQASSR